MIAPRNILDMLCDYISIDQLHITMQFSHEVPFISINKPLFDYLKSQSEAERAKRKKVVSDKMIDGWMQRVKKEAVNSLQKARDNIVKYALLSDRDIASDEVMALLEKSYNDSAG